MKNGVPFVINQARNCNLFFEVTTQQFYTTNQIKKHPLLELEDSHSKDKFCFVFCFLFFDQVQCFNGVLETESSFNKDEEV